MIFIVFTDYITGQHFTMRSDLIKVIEARSDKLAYLETKSGYSYLAAEFKFVTYN